MHQQFIEHILNGQLLMLPISQLKKFVLKFYLILERGNFLIT